MKAGAVRMPISHAAMILAALVFPRGASAQPAGTAEPGGFYQGGLQSQTNFCFDGGAEARLQIVEGRARLAVTSGTAGSFWAYPRVDVGSGGAFRINTAADIIEGSVLPSGDYEVTVRPLSNTCRWYMRLKRVGPAYRRRDHQLQPTARVCRTEREIGGERSVLRTRVSSEGGWCGNEASKNWLWPWDNFEILTPPQHGEIRTRAGQTGSMIDFRPTPGYVGEDTVTIRAGKTNSTNRVYEITYDVTR